MVTETHSDTPDRERRNFELVLDIGFPEPCPLADLPAGVSEISLRTHGQGCEIDIVHQPEGQDGGLEIRHVSTTKPEQETEPCACVCSIFKRHDCLPHLKQHVDGGLTVMTYPPSRVRGSDLVRALQEECESVTLQGVHGTETPAGGSRRTVDVSAVTLKQQEAMRLAVNRDFFGPGGDATLEELAEVIGIASSAFSQRLGRAKTEIFGQLFD
jgi:hypothetical protein